ncbi:MAG: hypothetical protein ABJA37_07150 [Ferruginibacter sp.]
MKYTFLNSKIFLIPLLSGFLVSSCNHKIKQQRTVTRSIYYWKSIFKLSAFEKQKLDSLKINTIYLKLFDVDWDASSASPAPVAQIQIADKEFLQQKNIIPTVFITNECIYKIDNTQTAEVANKIVKLMDNISAINQFKKVKEIQIDCDWSSGTKDKYFSILKTLKHLDTAILISATIRLHQIKFMAKSGVPPVDKGLLMCYNMGNLKNPATGNSIIETNELKKYISNLTNYPLPLDVAFPLFEWKVLFRKGNYAGLIQNLPDRILSKSFVTIKTNRYSFLKDTLLNGYEFKKGDFLRNEKSSYDEIIAAAKIINNKLPGKNFRVSLFHLDSLTLSKYSNNELENIYRIFN